MTSVSASDAIRVVGVCGSLRRVSLNGAVIAAAAKLAAAGVEVTPYRGLADLPQFNPDLDEKDTPQAVALLRRTMAAADGLLISSPEYAHGVPGALKNALDWMVGSGELIDKPVAVINASARATHAWHSLVETLTTMSASVIRDASITLPLDGRPADADAIAADPRCAEAIRAALDSVATAARAARR
jgi:chromate reductase, NAD(P)H dehydrogenase (quinone)